MAKSLPDSLREFLNGNKFDQTRPFLVAYLEGDLGSLNYTHEVFTNTAPIVRLGLISLLKTRLSDLENAMMYPEEFIEEDDIDSVLRDTFEEHLESFKSALLSGDMDVTLVDFLADIREKTGGFGGSKANQQ